MRAYSFPVGDPDDRAERSDEDLLRELASGNEEAIGALYARHAALLLRISAQAFDRATAEEIVQDAFVAVWKNAASFDPARGPLRPWLLQITHFRIANELRRRSRRPNTRIDPEAAGLENLPDPEPDPSEKLRTE